MGERPESVQVEIALNWADMPEETEIIYKTAQKGNIGSLLYVVMRDINTGVYDMNESHRQQILDGLVETVTTIYNAMSGMDKNVTDLIFAVNNMDGNYQKLQNKINSINVSPKDTLDEDTFAPVLDLSETEEEVEIIDIGGEGEGDDLDIEGMADIFDL